MHYQPRLQATVYHNHIVTFIVYYHALKNRAACTGTYMLMLRMIYG